VLLRCSLVLLPKQGSLSLSKVQFLDDGEKYALVLYCEKIPSEDTKEALTFMGGFDPPEIVYDHSKETKILSLMYPAVDAEHLAKQIGSIDYR
jgi:hypothetical protein